MITKTYASRYPKFSVGLMEGKERKEIRFSVRDVDTGGVKLVTQDELLQAKLEKLESFNVHFKLESAIETPDPVNVEVPEAEREVITEVEPVAETATIAESEPVFFKTVQDAKNWLNDVHHVPFNEITNKEKVLGKASELGLNIVFE